MNLMNQQLLYVYPAHRAISLQLIELYYKLLRQVPSEKWKDEKSKKVNYLLGWAVVGEEDFSWQPTGQQQIQ